MEKQQLLIHLWGSCYDKSCLLCNLSIMVDFWKTLPCLLAFQAWLSWPLGNINQLPSASSRLLSTTVTVQRWVTSASGTMVFQHFVCSFLDLYWLQGEYIPKAISVLDISQFSWSRSFISLHLADQDQVRIILRPYLVHKSLLFLLCLQQTQLVNVVLNRKKKNLRLVLSHLISVEYQLLCRHLPFQWLSALQLQTVVLIDFSLTFHFFSVAAAFSLTLLVNTHTNTEL